MTDIHGLDLINTTISAIIYRSVQPHHSSWREREIQQKGTDHQIKTLER